MASYISGLSMAQDSASLGDQIRQLELEGSILRSQVDDILSDDCSTESSLWMQSVGQSGREDRQTPLPPGTPTFYDSSSRPHSRAARSREHSRSPYRHQRSSSVDAILAGDGGPGANQPSNYSHLADSSAEQREIDTMSSKLDAQAAAATSLQHRLRYASAAPPLQPYQQPQPHQPRQFHYHHPAPLLSRTDVLLPPASAERELRDTREQAEHLRQQLRAGHDRQLREKAELRAQLDGLRARLMEASAGRESLAAQRAREADAQEELVARLQGSLQSLQQANRDQEEALLETNRRLDTAKQRQFALEGVVADVRGLLADAESRRGRAFFDREPAAHQAVGMLAGTLDRCLQEFAAELEDRMRDIGTLERELSDSRRAFLAEKEDLERSWQRRCDQTSEQFEAELRKCRERAQDDQRKLEQLGGEARRSEEQLRAQSETRSGRISELEATLSRLIDDYDRDRKAWESKRAAVEAGLDEAQRELADARHQREEAVRESALLEPRCLSAEAEAAELRAERDELETARDAAEAAADAVKERLSAKATEVAELRALIDALKEETDSLTREQVNRALAEEQQYTQAQSRNLATQLAVQTEACELQAKELQAARADLAAVERRLAGQTEERLGLEEQLTASLEERDHLGERLRMREGEVARLAAERDRQYEQEASRAQQLASVLEDYRHLVSLFEDRSGQLAALESRRRLGGAELERAAVERDALYLELKDSRLEVAALRQDAEAARIIGARESEALRRRASELGARLRDAKAELALARDALKAKEEAAAAAAASVVISRRQQAPAAASGRAKQQQQQKKQLQQLQEKRLMALEADNERLVAELDCWSRQCREATNSARQIEAANRRLRAQLAACQHVLRQRLPEAADAVKGADAGGGSDGADGIRAALADIQGLLSRHHRDVGETDADANADGEGDNRLRESGGFGESQADRAISPTGRRLLRSHGAGSPSGAKDRLRDGSSGRQRTSQQQAA